jgi:hypothetical protein
MVTAKDAWLGLPSGRCCCCVSALDNPPHPNLGVTEAHCNLQSSGSKVFYNFSSPLIDNIGWNCNNMANQHNRYLDSIH